MYSSCRQTLKRLDFNSKVVQFKLRHQLAAKIFFTICSLKIQILFPCTAPTHFPLQCLSSILKISNLVILLNPKMLYKFMSLLEINGKAHIDFNKPNKLPFKLQKSEVGHLAPDGLKLVFQDRFSRAILESRFHSCWDWSHQV